MSIVNENAWVRRVTVQLDDDLHKRLKVLSAESVTTLNDIFVEAVKRYLKDAEDSEKLSVDIGK